MDAISYAAAFLLAFVFVRAGVAKLVRPEPTAAAFAAMGLPAPAFLSRAVPVAELLLAVTLVATPLRGGVAALALLAPFTAVLVRQVRAGSGAGCACFGTDSSRPVSGIDLLRNALLAVLAVVAIAASAL